MIYIVRHGQTDWNVAKRCQGQTDIPLNDTGRAQARATAGEVAKIKIERIISSDLSRARETAEIIGRHIGVAVETDVRIREGDCGTCAGRVMTHEDWEEFNIDPKKYNGESLEDMFIRTKSFMDEIRHLENVLVVTHAGTLRMIMYCAKHEVFDRNIAEEYRSLKFENACLVKWK